MLGSAAKQCGNDLSCESHGQSAASIQHLRLIQFEGRTWQPIGDVLEAAFSHAQKEVSPRRSLAGELGVMARLAVARGYSPPAPFGLRRGILLSLSRAKDGGRDRDRTCDPYHVKVVLSR